MAIGKHIIEIEGQRGILQIMLVLQQNGEMLFGNLYNNRPHLEISNNLTAKRAIDILKKYKLICQKEVKGKKAIYYRLTDKGEGFVKCINDMEKILIKK